MRSASPTASSKSSCARRWRRATSGPGSSTACRTTKARADVVDGIRLTMEGLALTGAWTDPARGLISLIVLGDGRLVAPVLDARAGRRDRAHGSDRNADGDSRGRDGAARRRRPGQRGAVLDRRGDEGARQPRRLLRRLQARRRPLQAALHRGRLRPGGVERRRGRADRRASSAGPQRRRQHRAGDAALRRAASSATCRSACRTSTGSSASAPIA